MNPIAILVGLLALAYLGSVLVGRRGTSRFGLPSGTEYVLLGFAAGPHVLGLVNAESVRGFQPIAAVLIGWLSLVIGLDYGRVQSKMASARGIVTGIALAAFCAASTGCAVYLFALRYTDLRGADLLRTAAGTAAVACETTRHAVRWVVARSDARGPLSKLVSEAAETDEIVPLLIFAVLLASSAPGEPALGIWGWSLVTLGLGVLLGAVCAALLGAETSAGDAWGVLVGGALLAIGVAWRLGLSMPTALFAMGVSVVAFSRHRHELRFLFLKTERPVLLPTLVLAGAHLDLSLFPRLLGVVVVAVASRILLRMLCGPIVSFAARAPGGLLAGLGTLSSGSVTMALGLCAALLYPGVVGGVILATATAVTVIGELIGPVALSRAFAQAGETPIAETSREPEPTAGRV